MAALREHVKRSAFVSGHLWGRANHLNPVLPNYSHWGWNYKSDGGLTPIWTTIVNDIAYKALKKTCRCGDKNSCQKITVAVKM